jgi:hypothetical protein
LAEVAFCQELISRGGNVLPAIKVWVNGLNLIENMFQSVTDYGLLSFSLNNFASPFDWNTSIVEHANCSELCANPGP